MGQAVYRTIDDVEWFIHSVATYKGYDTTFRRDGEPVAEADVPESVFSELCEAVEAAYKQRHRQRELGWYGERGVTPLGEP